MFDFPTIIINEKEHIPSDMHYEFKLECRTKFTISAYKYETFHIVIYDMNSNKYNVGLDEVLKLVYNFYLEKGNKLLQFQFAIYHSQKSPYNTKFKISLRGNFNKIHDFKNLYIIPMDGRTDINRWYLTYGRHFSLTYNIK